MAKQNKFAPGTFPRKIVMFDVDLTVPYKEQWVKNWMPDNHKVVAIEHSFNSSLVRYYAQGPTLPEAANEGAIPLVYPVLVQKEKPTGLEQFIFDWNLP